MIIPKRSQLDTRCRPVEIRLWLGESLFFEEGASMRKVAVVALTALAAILGDCVSYNAFGGEVSVHHHVRKCGRYDHCGFPVLCPSGTCYSLYGAYGPFGGALYWGRYTYSGWPTR
jgi:hypothetical protein